MQCISNTFGMGCDQNLKSHSIWQFVTTTLFAKNHSCAFLQLNSIYDKASEQGKAPVGESSKHLDGSNTADNDSNTINTPQVPHHLFLTLLNPEPLLAQVLPWCQFNPSHVNPCSYSDSSPLWLLANLSWCLRPYCCLWGFPSAHKSRDQGFICVVEYVLSQPDRKISGVFFSDFS